jgi:CxxC motif-containing protein
MVSVKTGSNIPKEKIFDCIAALKNLEVKAPVEMGEVMLRNVADTGIDIIATKSVTLV